MSSPAAAMRSGALVPWLALAAAIAIADQFTKWLLARTIQPGEILPVTGFFNLVHVFNKGAAFSFLATAGGWQRAFFIAVTLAAVVLIVYLLRRHGGDRLFCLGLTLILGGALGNLWDRAVLGHVVDFLDFHASGWHWPAFNVADSAITVGAGLLIVDTLRSGRAERGRPDAGGAAR
ncbi:MAG: signal peptidase II [Burkholderiales bacterium]|jgi:signal peptidase II|nr:signal peptidase II [Burkholderiales bacterium]